MTGLELFSNSDVKGFIQSNLQSDIQKLLLNPPTQFRASIKAIVDQIQARQKAKGKLDTWAANFELILPPPLSVEQASSEKTASYKKEIVKGKHFVDLSGWMGIDWIALSENFEHTTYVEVKPEVASVFEYNQKVLGRNIRVINADALKFIDKLEPDHSKDLVFYVDPARRDSAQNKVFRLEECSPDILGILPTLRKLGNRILVKLSPLVDLKSLLKQIPNIKELHVVSVKNDCKELLILIDFSFQGEVLIKTVNFSEEIERFDFTVMGEQSTEATFSPVDKFLLEPNASILKAGAFKKIGVDFRLSKVNPNTHLYTSNQIRQNWPGRIFEILEDKMDKKNLRKYASEGFINVLTRNHPLNAKELKKKYKLRDGGELFLIGFRDMNEKSRLVIGKRVIS